MRNKSRWWCRAAVVVCIGMLTACGFHLRGSDSNAPWPARIAITAEDRELVTRLAMLLTERGATLTPTAQATYAVNITAHEFQQELLTTNTAGKATAYTLRYRVVYEVRAGDADAESRTLSIERILQYSDALQLQFDNEKRFLQADMRAAAARRIAQHLVRQPLAP